MIPAEIDAVADGVKAPVYVIAMVARIGSSGRGVRQGNALLTEALGFLWRGDFKIEFNVVSLALNRRPDAHQGRGRHARRRRAFSGRGGAGAPLRALTWCARGLIARRAGRPGIPLQRVCQ